MTKGIADWLQRNRTSVRMAFGLRLTAMAAGSLLGLLFSRILVHAMGAPLYGQYLSFQGVTRLGGLSDLGLSGAVAYWAGQHLGRREDDKLRRLLASSRSVFLIIGFAIFAGFVVLSPWLAGWLKFEELDGTGSLQILFISGGATVGALVVAGYFHSLNVAHGTVTWPVLPVVLFSQVLAPIAHVYLARAHQPLWVQCLPYFVALCLTAVLAWQMLKWAHPWLGDLLPLGADRQLWKELAGTSGWVYLATLGSAIYYSTDRLLVQAGFGAGAVPAYTFNYKLSELATVVIVTGSFVSVPKITQWLASGKPEDIQRVAAEARTLNTVQIVMGAGAVLAYLAVNDAFVTRYYGETFRGSLWLQAAFAFNLAVTTGGDAGITIAARAGRNGVRNAGIAVGGTGLLNLALSYISMRNGFLTGIAASTFVAQVALSASLAWLTCRHLGVNYAGWLGKSLLLPIVVTAAGFGLRLAFPPESAGNIAILAAAYLGILGVAAWLAGVDREMIEREWRLVRGMLSGAG